MELPDLIAQADASLLKIASGTVEYEHLKAWCRVQRLVILGEPRRVLTIANVEIPMPYQRGRGYFREFILTAEYLVAHHKDLQAVVVENVHNERLGTGLGKHQYTKFRVPGADFGVFNYYKLKEKCNAL